MKKSQGQKILNHLKRGKTISTLQAVKLFGCLRLSERIRELKEAGYRIGAYWTKTRTGRAYVYYMTEGEITGMRFSDALRRA